MVGIVASPTPTVPISGDSINVMAQEPSLSRCAQRGGGHPAGGAATDDDDAADALRRRGTHDGLLAPHRAMKSRCTGNAAARLRISALMPARAR